jgi:7,8-dihydropterin-6-yl-methyl-4-(beta-D-ribofuranosyl)aminobenzene 5'-phosphate synthase
MLKSSSTKITKITILVENKADLIVQSSDRVKYFTDEPLLAEHGFSALVELNGSGEYILWDAGVSRIALINNLKLMKFDPGTIKMIAISHGHLDHYAAMKDLLELMDPIPDAREWSPSVSSSQVDAWQDLHRVPVILHPAALRERWSVMDNETMVGPYPPPPWKEWESSGARMILSEGPYQLAEGCWTTGYVPRKSFEEAGRSKKRLYRNASGFNPDQLEDDQAILINLEEKGLVVLSGCAHSGIVNTIEHARMISGVDRVHAVIGGFHLATAGDDEIFQTVEYLREIGPELIVPCHCTGLRAISHIASEMSDAFVEGVVGACFTFQNN